MVCLLLFLNDHILPLLLFVTNNASKDNQPGLAKTLYSLFFMIKIGMLLAIIFCTI